MSTATTLVKNIAAIPDAQALLEQAKTLDAHLQTLGNEERPGRRVGRDAFEEVEICRIRREVGRVQGDAFKLQQEEAGVQHDMLMSRAADLSKQIATRRAKVAAALATVAPMLEEMAKLDGERRRVRQVAEYVNNAFHLERRPTGDSTPAPSPRRLLEAIAGELLPHD